MQFVAGRPFLFCCSVYDFSDPTSIYSYTPFFFLATSTHRVKLLGDFLVVPFITGHFGPKYSLMYLLAG
jgi:hypothetical protein